MTQDPSKVGVKTLDLTCTSNVSTMTPNNSDTQSWTVEFQLPTPSCRMDILSIGKVYERRTYSVTETNSAVMFFDFQISQTVLGCPVECSLGEIPSLTDYTSAPAPITFFD